MRNKMKIKGGLCGLLLWFLALRRWPTARSQSAHIGCPNDEYCQLLGSKLLCVPYGDPPRMMCLHCNAVEPARCKQLRKPRQVPPTPRPSTTTTQYTPPTTQTTTTTPAPPTIPTNPFENDYFDEVVNLFLFQTPCNMWVLYFGYAMIGFSLFYCAVIGAFFIPGFPGYSLLNKRKRRKEAKKKKKEAAKKLKAAKAGDADVEAALSDKNAQSKPSIKSSTSKKTKARANSKGKESKRGSKK